MSRRKKLLLNTGSGILKQIVVIVCGFILPRYILMYYGSDINGLVSSITQFLSFISFLELGIGPVIQSNLYKPLADKNTREISKIVISSERFFRRIAKIFIGYIIILFFVYPIFVNTKYEFFFTGSLIFIISISTFAQYYFGMSYQVLLNADQKAYVQQSLQIVTILANTVLSVLLIICGAPIHFVKLITSLIYVLRPIGQSIYVKRHYKIDRNVIIEGEVIKQKWNGFAQHIAAVVNTNADVAILTFFSSLKSVSIYTVYFNVTNGLTNLIMTMFNGLEAIWGNMLAKNEWSLLKDTFIKTEIVVHLLVTVLFTIAGIMIVPFIMVYTRGINDANYAVPIFATLLVMAAGAQCLRVPYFRIIKAAGHYKQTQNGAIIAVFVNVIISVACVFAFDLNGVAIGTFLSMLYHTCYFAWYLRKNILNRSILFFIKHLIVDVLIIVISVLSVSHFNLDVYNYFQWVIQAIKVTILVTCIGVFLNLILYRRTFIDSIQILTKRQKKKK